MTQWQGAQHFCDVNLRLRSAGPAPTPSHWRTCQSDGDSWVTSLNPDMESGCSGYGTALSALARLPPDYNEGEKWTRNLLEPMYLRSITSASTAPQPTGRPAKELCQTPPVPQPSCLPRDSETVTIRLVHSATNSHSTHPITACLSFLFPSVHKHNWPSDGSPYTEGEEWEGTEHQLRKDIYCGSSQHVGKCKIYTLTGGHIL